MQDALWAGKPIRSGVQGNSLFLDIFIMLPFCDAILIQFKISNVKNHYICHQLWWLPDPSFGCTGFHSTTLIRSKWLGLLDSQGTVWELTGKCKPFYVLQFICLFDTDLVRNNEDTQKWSYMNKIAQKTNKKSWTQPLLSLMRISFPYGCIPLCFIKIWMICKPPALCAF